MRRLAVLLVAAATTLIPTVVGAAPGDDAPPPPPTLPVDNPRPESPTTSGPGGESEQSTNDSSAGAGADSETGVITAFVNSTTSTVSVTTNGKKPKPECTFTKALYGDLFSGQAPAVIGEGQGPGDQITEAPNADGVSRLGWYRKCGTAPQQFVWIAPTVDVQALITQATNRATAQIPLPDLDISPSPENGGIVNLGLWVALEQPGNPIASASLGGVTATVTATHGGFTVDFGDGETRTCTGLGTPIVDKDTVEEGPCGYTYRESSPDDKPYQMTVTSTWNLSYTTSLGGSGALTDVVRSITVDYDVDEIQTVGINN